MAQVQESEARKLAYVSAITEGVRAVLSEQDDAFVLGEDVAGAGSVYGYYTGLLDEFGPERVIDSPISEKGIIGVGVGAAASGLRPVLDIMFMDFLAECMDEVANQMAKMRFMFGGSAKLPITVLTMAGAGMSMAAQHSQSLESWLCHIPGLKVVMPSTGHDAKGLIIGAARDDNPTFVILNKVSLAMQSEVPEPSYGLPLGQANIVRPGTNLTIVALGRMVHEALKAAEQLEPLGIDAEVIDPRTLQPLDTDALVGSVEKTHRVMVVHEAVRFGGFGGEIAAQLQELAFDYLDAPVGRIGAPFSPVPFSPALEKAYVPDAERIVAETRRHLGV